MKENLNLMTLMEGMYCDRRLFCYFSNLLFHIAYRTTVCIAGDDFAIAAGCTRMSTGYEILSRSQGKLLQLSDKTVLASVGCQADITTLNKVLITRFAE